MDKGKEMEVKRLGVLSTGKIAALLGAFGGFLLGIFGVLISQSSNLQQTLGFEPSTSSLSIAQLISTPFIFALIYMIMFGLIGLLFAWFYNIIAKTGGLKIELK
jgi:hypothetical protein